MSKLSTKLRIEKSLNCSGTIFNENSIFHLKEKDYFVEDFSLDGDAPKQFIKIYLYQKNNTIRRSNPNTWVPFIAKTAEKWYPHESTIEYMINRVGEEVGLRMNEVELFRINGQIRFLSKYFLKRNETLIHGAEICGEYINDHALAAKIANEKCTSREVFTFEFIYDAIKSIFQESYKEIIYDIVRMITFDALVGNNDRHFYNWGIIATKKKTNQLPRLAPLYDSSRGLLWNLSDENIIKYKTLHEKGNSNKLLNYIENASPRISINGDSQINHFGLINYLKNTNPDYKVIIENLASIDNEQKVIKMLEKEFSHFYCEERNYLIAFIISNRFKKIREVTC